MEDSNDIGTQTKCPKCGATDISQNAKTGKLRCNYCRHEFDPVVSDQIVEDASVLEGESVSGGAADIDESQSATITLKCKSCGAEVVVDTNHTTSARCHWCRNHLSIDNQIPNGAVPDMILPFRIAKDEAKTAINSFVSARSFFAHPQFKKEFSADNIMGVYFPYMIIDANVKAGLEGEGEVLIRSYWEGNKDNRRQYFDARVYDVARSFDMAVSGLTIESSRERLDRHSESQTNNIINSIMPFDTDHCVKYDSNYLRGYSSEKRDVNVDELRPKVSTQLEDIARHAALPSLGRYDRGVRWTYEKYDIKGINWNAAYLPVWLYSYMDSNKTKHFVAVNARTKETMGSIPINKFRLFVMSVVVEILAIILMVMMLPFFAGDDDASFLPFLLLAAGPIYAWYIYSRYRNKSARHSHESETSTILSNEEQLDNPVGTRTRLRSSRINGENYKAVKA